MTTTSSGFTLVPGYSMLTGSRTNWPVYIGPGVAPSETTNHCSEAQQGCNSSSAGSHEYDYPQHFGEGVGHQLSGHCRGGPPSHRVTVDASSLSVDAEAASFATRNSNSVLPLRRLM